METIFCKLKDYIQDISTAFQWLKYHVKPYNDTIATLEQVQDTQLSNKALMALTVKADKVSLEFSQESHLKVHQVGSRIVYNEFNTEASVELQKVDLIV